MYAQGPVKDAVIDSAAGDSTLVAAVASKKIRVMSMVLNVTNASTVRFESTAGGTALTGVMSLAAKDTLILPEAPNGWFETVAGELLNLELTTGPADGHLTYQEID